MSWDSNGDEEGGGMDRADLLLTVFALACVVFLILLR